MAKAIKHRRNQHALTILAANVRRYRIEKKLTIEALAHLANLEYAQLSKLERGLLNTNISILFDLAQALEIAPGLLLEELL